MAAYSFSELYGVVGEFLGLGTTLAAANLVICKAVVNRAYRKVINAEAWSYLRKEGSINTVVDKWEYMLPSDYVGLVNNSLAYDNETYPDIREADSLTIRSNRANSTNVTGYPSSFAIAEENYAVSVGSRFKMQLYPTPEAAYTLYYRYYFDPPQLTGTGDIPIGLGTLADVIMQACLSEAELTQDEKEGPQTSSYMRLLNQAKILDRKIRVVGNLGYNGNGMLIGKSPATPDTYYDGVLQS